MAAVLTIIVILLSLTNDVSTSTAQRSGIKTDGVSKRRPKNSCSSSIMCISSTKNVSPLEKRSGKRCSVSTDCLVEEYCHPFHRLCLKPKGTVNDPLVRTPANKCSRNSSCKTKEYCHKMWKICLPHQEMFKDPHTQKPSWYCDNSSNCRIDQECHKTFHVCFTRTRVPAVRRSIVNSRKCNSNSDCGSRHYCHDHFRICLSNTGTTTRELDKKASKVRRCRSNRECRNGMSCHKVWKICFTPAKHFVLRQNNTRQCEMNSDCKGDEFCHIMAGKRLAIIARHRRNTLGVCLPRKLKQSRKPEESPRCKTDAECGPNKCCLDKLGVCLAYPLPGEMCLLEKADFVCPCTNRSFCHPRGKHASLKRIISRMRLPQSVADYVLTSSHERKHKVGKCIPGSLN